MDLALELKERITRGSVDLMPQPQAVVRLREVVADAAHTRGQLVDAIKLCPVLTAVVLRLANTPPETGGVAITRLPRAVARIGAEDLARLARASSVVTTPWLAGPLSELRIRVLKDALTSAQFCKRLAPAFGLDAEGLFVDGLLHDIGTLVALGTLEQIIEQHAEVQPLTAAAWLVLAEREHVELGNVIGEAWRLPDEVRRAIADHHLPDAGGRDATSVVRISDELVRLVHAGSALTAQKLPWLERVEAGARAGLLEALTAVTTEVPLFEAGTPWASSRSSIHSAPSMAPSTALLIPVKISGGHTGELAILGPQRFQLRLATPLKANHLAELELTVAGVPLKLWVRVTHNGGVGSDGRAEADVVPFAQSVKVAERLTVLWANHTSSPARPT